MILELDCGNSFIKWRVLKAALGAVFSEGVVDSDLALLDSLKALNGLSFVSAAWSVSGLRRRLMP